MLLLALGACGPDARPEAPVLAIRLEPAGDATRLVLTAAAGWKIGARLKPALEIAPNAVVRFDAASLTPDSAYFAEPPTALVSGRRSAVHGTLRASACAARERVCRLVVVRL